MKSSRSLVENRELPVKPWSPPTMRPSCMRFMLRRLREAVALVGVATVATAAGRADTPSTPTDTPVSLAPTPKAEGAVPKADFRRPKGAVIAFLAAAKAKDPVRVREATALDAATNAGPRNQALFAAILNGNPSENDLTQLASKLEGFEVVGNGEPTWTAQLDIYIGKPGPDGSQFLRKIKTRKDKTGWKVRDIGEPSVRKKPMVMIPEKRNP